MLDNASELAKILVVACVGNPRVVQTTLGDPPTFESSHVRPLRMVIVRPEIPKVVTVADV
jgi:hypothetical protein